MKLYLAGPMTGYEGLNFPQFHSLTKALRGLGFEIVNPAEVNADTTAKWEDCMRADIRELMTCDGVAAMTGWEKSRGAKIEVGIARSLGMPVFCAHRLIESAITV